jgi:hypothetical protein
MTIRGWKKINSKAQACCPIKKNITLFYGHENHGKMTKKKTKRRQAKRQAKRKANLQKSMGKKH